MRRSPTRASRTVAPLLLPFIGLVALGGCREVDPVTPVNQPPSITLISPEPDANGDPLPIEVGEGLTFEVAVNDAEDLAEELVVSWIAERTDQGGVQLDLGEGNADASGRATQVVGGLESGRYTIIARVTDTRGATDETGLPVEVFAINEAPTVSITQPSGGADFLEDEQVTFVATATDDRNVTGLSVEWFSNRDGLINSAPPISSGLMTFTTTNLSVGEHTVTARVTDEEGLLGEDAVVFEVIAEDLPPNAPTVEISPAAPLSSDPLSCLITVGSSDPEGQPITYTYTWFRDGTQTLNTTANLAASETSAGEDWLCRVVASDGTLSSDPGEDSVTIGNQLPSVVEAVLGPDPAFETSVLTCTGVGWEDLDGDPENYDYAWLVDGTLLTGITTDTLDGAWFNRDQTVQCELTPNDGLGVGTPVLSNVLTISNSAPTAPVVSVGPTPQADIEDDLVCQVDADSTDPDGDTFVYLVSWFVDGVYDSAYDGQWTIASGETNLGEVWECQVAADDLEDVGLPGTASTTVLPDPGDWVITEIMATPAAVSGAAGEWVELYNASGSTMNLNGFELHDDGSDSHFINADIIVPSGARVVLTRNSDLGTNGGVFSAYEYSGFVLGNTQDQVVLSFQGTEIDRFDYDLTTYSPSLSGRALALDPSLGSPDPILNDSSSNWCGSSNPITGPGSDFGTPGGVNDSCACYFSDGDGDGWGTDASCGLLDCDDNDVNWNPAATDICEDGLDQNCDGADAVCPCLQTDGDGDGFGDGLGCSPADCNDSNPFIYPGAAELCNNIDEDCNGVLDDGDPAFMCAPTSMVATTQCSSATCLVATCTAGWYDVDGIYSNGCETEDLVTNSCASAISLGSVGSGGVSQSAVANIPGSGSDWYVVTFAQSGRPGVGTPTIAFSQNDGNEYKMNLRYSCSTGNVCADRTQWSFADNTGSAGYSVNNVAWPTTVYVQVVRSGGNAQSTADYRLQVTR